MRPITAPVSAVSPVSRAAIFGGTGSRLDPGSDAAPAGVLTGGLDDEVSVAAIISPFAGIDRTTRQKARRDVVDEDRGLLRGPASRTQPTSVVPGSPVRRRAGLYMPTSSMRQRRAAGF